MNDQLGLSIEILNQNLIELNEGLNEIQSDLDNKQLV